MGAVKPATGMVPIHIGTLRSRNVAITSRPSGGQRNGLIRYIPTEYGFPIACAISYIVSAASTLDIGVVSNNGSGRVQLNSQVVLYIAISWRGSGRSSGRTT